MNGLLHPKRLLQAARESHCEISIHLPPGMTTELRFDFNVFRRVGTRRKMRSTFNFSEIMMERDNHGALGIVQ